MISSKVELEKTLEEVGTFNKPKLFFEQYRLPAPVAAEILWYAHLRHNDVEGKTIVDLGCGTGMLTLGAALLGAEYVVGLDIDQNAISDARKTAIRLGLGMRSDFVVGDVRFLGLRADVVIQNPPFGVRRREADRAFIVAGLSIAPKVYSLHRGGESVRRFIFRFVGDVGGKVDEVLPLKIKLPPTYHFHRKRFYLFEADLYRIVRVKQ
ncbi:MAG: METTL5 family protein [Candidatus Methanomethyliaceae archaeon]|nr:METTL5 family protein [Candidatus Methanomethyliaceae archaeon]